MARVHQVSVSAVLMLLALLTTACGGILNPPVPTPTRTPLPTLPPTSRPATATPVPEQWVKNHRVTQMWSGPAGAPGVVSFGPTSTAFCSFRIERQEENARMFVYNPYTDSHFWIDADDVGPVVPPERRPGPKPAGVNCAEIVYEPRLSATPGQTATAIPRPSETALPAALNVTPQAAPDPRPGQPLVLALYYPWYDLSTWERGETSDLPQQPYGSSDPITIGRHVGWAREAGIDVLVSAWYGPKDANPTETNFRALLTEAERTGLKAALLLETDNDDFYPDRAILAQALRHFLAVHASHPAYLRIDGRPVMLVWNPKSVYATDGRRVNAKSAAAVSAWSSLIAEVDPQRKALWIAEGDFFEILGVFDGIFPYSIAWSPDPAKQLNSYGESVRSRAASLGARKVWAATAMPGYDDTRINGRAPTFAVNRQNGSYYERTFQGAIESRPDWVVITSFNEWLEGTQIEPSQAYGRQYLDLTRTLADRFKRQ
jgi:hypothetical protein